MTHTAFEPVVAELAPPHDVERWLGRLASLPYCFLLDSAMGHDTLGRYSFLSADPFARLDVAHDGSEALATLQQRLHAWTSAPIGGLPPFQGGVVGVFGYELNHQLEKLPRTRFDPFRLPSLAVGFYDVVIAIDLHAGRAWIISQGLPETEPAARRQRAVARLAQFKDRLLSAHDSPVWQPKRKTIAIDAAPQLHEVGGGLASNFSAESYRRAVERVIAYIHAGDVFQVNLSQKFLCREASNALELYLRLRRRNPAPFAAYMHLGGSEIASASPERFMRVVDGTVETRPIKGTRRIGDGDSAAKAEPLDCREKDRAENIMIVDLLRNDLSRVCRPDSVRVSQLCGVERYPFVEHLVSVVEGKLRPPAAAVDLIAATFPGGSITGAPKVRAMEIIAELEQTARGFYCGSAGYIGFDGGMDLNILIRTITSAGGWWQFSVGGGIVAPSDPQLEYEETWHKAEGLLRSLSP